MNIDELEKTLATLSARELRERFATCYGHTPTTRNRAHLIKKILWAAQRDVFGDISDAARKKALAIADDRDVKGRFPNVQRPPENKNQTATIAYRPDSKLLPGTVLHRNYKGEDIRVLVLENGFEWNDQRFKSISAVARAVTGTRWNGKLFFGLKKGK
ncbi:DUF2924 domain-containing protein [Pontiellaceae bacterium B12227]|nr:DUF2924 domain-containing protein [Pontiellaceae bacterium B12227]